MSLLLTTENEFSLLEKVTNSYLFMGIAFVVLLHIAAVVIYFVYLLLEISQPNTYKTTKRQ